MDPSLLIVIVGSGSALCALAFKLCFASHCTKIKLCCGLVDVTRETESEQVINIDNAQPQSNASI